MKLAQWLQSRWFEKASPLRSMGLVGWLMLPLYWAYLLLTALRQQAYKRGWLAVVRLPVPVVVVGNITVGGAGKTPLSLGLVETLKQAGFKPGMVSRGYGGTVDGVSEVLPGDDPARVGDEPLLLARRSGVPVFVGRLRSEAGKALLSAYPEVDLLVCDDGLQHLAMARDLEIAVLDGRGVGNGWRLPLGPLRDPVSRLNGVDALVFNGSVASELRVHGPIFAMDLVPGKLYGLREAACQIGADELKGLRLYAAAGIGHPDRFFDTLRKLGLDFEARAFPDHHAYTAADLDFARDGVLLLTEKDGVKCAPIYDGPAWVLPVEARLPSALAELIVEKIRGRQVA